MDKETWIPIEGYEGLYSVSNLGRVRSEERVITRSDGRPQKIPQAIKKPTPDGRGYPRVVLYRNNQQKHFTIHQLMARAFIGPQEPGMQVRHKNGNKLDCRLENLEYGTDSDNKYDAVRHGTHTNAAKTHCKRGHEFTPENTYTFQQVTKIGNITTGRQCRECVRARQRARYAARKAAPGDAN